MNFGWRSRVVSSQNGSFGAKKIVCAFGVVSKIGTKLDNKGRAEWNNLTRSVSRLVCLCISTLYLILEWLEAISPWNGDIPRIDQMYNLSLFDLKPVVPFDIQLCVTHWKIVTECRRLHVTFPVTVCDVLHHRLWVQRHTAVGSLRSYLSGFFFFSNNQLKLSIPFISTPVFKYCVNTWSNVIPD